MSRAVAGLADNIAGGIGGGSVASIALITTGAAA